MLPRKLKYYVMLFLLLYKNIHMLKNLRKSLKKFYKVFKVTHQSDCSVCHVMSQILLASPYINYSYNALMMWQIMYIKILLWKALFLNVMRVFNFYAMFVDKPCFLLYAVVGSHIFVFILLYLLLSCSWMLILHSVMFGCLFSVSICLPVSSLATRPFLLVLSVMVFYVRTCRRCRKADHTSSHTLRL